MINFKPHIHHNHNFGELKEFFVPKDHNGDFLGATGDSEAQRTVVVIAQAQALFQFVNILLQVTPTFLMFIFGDNSCRSFD